MDRLYCVVASLGLLAWVPGAPAAEAEKIKPTPLPVNTAADEDEPHLADAGLTLFFTSNRDKKEDLMVATRRVAGGAWGKARVVEDYVSTSEDDRSAFATGGTFPHYLFFATKKDKEANNFDLYVAVKQDRGKAWSAPTPVMKVNTAEDELHPWVGDGGKALYFSRKTKDGWVQMMVTRAGTKGPGGWDSPVEVGLPAGFHHATLMPDGKTMYVQGPLEKGRWGLFVVRREGKGWGKPQPLDGLNDATGKTGDRSPNLSRDGKVLYFASDRRPGKGGMDLYYVVTDKLPKK